MPQFGRPDGDISVGNWSPFPSTPTTRFDKLNEDTPNDDTDYIVSATDEDECEFSLTSVVAPSIKTGHKIRCYAKSPDGGGGGEQMWIALMENGAERARSATATVNRTAFGLIEYILSEVEANTIQNYANLRLRFHITKTDADEPIRVTQAEFEAPDVGAEVLVSGSIDAVSGADGLIKASKKVSGSTDAISEVSGTVGVIRKISGGINAISNLAGDLRIVGAVFISGTISGISSFTGRITGVFRLSGLISALSGFLGNLTGGGVVGKARHLLTHLLEHLRMGN